MRRAFIPSLVSVALACSSDPSASEQDNLPPLASLRVPVIAPSATPVLIDASESHDPEGGKLEFVFDFHDGSDPVTSDEPIVEHIFVAPGLYTVWVTVADSSGQISDATHDVTVRDEYPSPPDFCVESADCVVGSLCEGGVCFSVGGRLD